MASRTHTQGTRDGLIKIRGALYGRVAPPLGKRTPMLWQPERTREKADNFYYNLKLFRRALASAIGRSHHDYRKIRDSSADVRDSEDPAEPVAPVTPVTPSA